MMVNFRENCNHARRTHKTIKPVIIENTKTKGIGFDDSGQCELNNYLWQYIHNIIVF